MQGLECGIFGGVCVCARMRVCLIDLPSCPCHWSLRPQELGCLLKLQLVSQ